MVEKPYKWPDGAKLEEHSKRKHKILREYFSRYLTVRCQLPQQEKFRLAIVEGFAGAGRYNCGAAGSPLIFIEELKAAVERFNIYRTSNGLKPLEIECLLILNDASPEAIEILKTHVSPLLAEVTQNHPKLHVRVEYRSDEFETAYPTVKQLLQNGRFRNVIFNLDQCGHSHVNRATLVDIMRSYPSAEIFYTFAIESLLAFLRASEPMALASQLASINLSETDLRDLEGGMNKKTWLGVAEKLVFGAFGSCAPFVSPFSINNPDGWRYWLIHFANSYRARQWYNDILHQNSSYQAHFGRSGLDMLSYDPNHDSGALYLFDMSGRTFAKDQLTADIPRLVSEFGDAMEVGTFYESIYNATPAHTDDIHSAIIDSPDLEVITEAGGERRKANTIIASDIIRIKTQRSFFPMFSVPPKPRS
jgi:three-Cys-motif partner protein